MKPTDTEIKMSVIAHLIAGYVKGPMAIDGKGHSVEASYPSACSWCLLGSFLASHFEATGSEPDVWTQPLWRRFEDSARKRADRSPISYSDSPYTTLNDVIKLVEEA